MAKRTVRKSDNGIELHANKNELLEYRLTVSGAGANFAWADDKQKILTQLDFGAADEIVWQLKSELTPDNKIKLTVPKNPNYQRVENAGARFSLVLTLGFVTAIGYTLTVRRKPDNAMPKDVDYAMEQPGEFVNEGLFVELL